MAFEAFVNPVFYPLLKLTGYFWTLTILSFVITLIITLIYKYTTNQSLMKDLKNEQKALQKQVKELKNEPEKAMAVQKKMMETNSKYMMHSFKPMIFTFLPILLFFGWMSSHLEFYPIIPGEEFSVTINFNDGVAGDVLLNLPDGLTSVNGLNQTIQAGQATWILKGDAGEYLLTYIFNGKTYTNEVLITKDMSYKPALRKVNKEGVVSIKTNLKPVLLLNLIFRKFGWLGTYIIFSMIFSTGLRKLMRVY